MSNKKTCRDCAHIDEDGRCSAPMPPMSSLPIWAVIALANESRFVGDGSLCVCCCNLYTQEDWKEPNHKETECPRS